MPDKSASIIYSLYESIQKKIHLHTKNFSQGCLTLPPNFEQVDQEVCMLSHILHYNVNLTVKYNEDWVTKWQFWRVS